MTRSLNPCTFTIGNPDVTTRVHPTPGTLAFLPLTR
jgi:hypothetical protein